MSCSCAVGYTACSWCTDPNNNPDKPPHSTLDEHSKSYECDVCGYPSWDLATDDCWRCYCDFKRK